MAERRPEIDVLIQLVSSASEPITLDEVKNRAERLEHLPAPLTADQAAVNGTPLLGSDEVVTLARPRARAADSVALRRAWIVSAAAAVALAAGILTVVSVLADQRDGNRISSTGPGFDVTEADPSSTSSSSVTFGSTTVAAPVEQTPSVVTMETNFAVLALLVLDDRRLVAAGEGDILQYWDPVHPDDGPTEVRVEDSFNAGAMPRSVSSLGRLPSGGLVVVSSFADSMALEEIDPESGFGLRGGQLTKDVAPQPKITVLRSGDVVFGGTGGLVTIGPVGDEGVRIDTKHTGTVLTVVELPDGMLVSAGSEGTIRIWDPATGVEDERSPVSVGHSDAVTALVVLADGRVASGDSNGAIRIWDPGRPVGAPAVLDGHLDAITGLVELPDGRLASGSADGTVRVWDRGLPTRNPTVLDQHTGAVKALAVLPDGRLASGSSDTTVRIWDVGSGPGPLDEVSGAELNTETPDVDNDGTADADIPVLVADRPPAVIECESGPPDFPPNDGESDLEPTVFPTPEEALDRVLASIHDGGTQWKDELIRIDTPDGSINYAAPTDPVLPVGSRPVEEALFLVVVRPSGSGDGYVAARWEMVGC
ncbi:MAG: hypothetical protein OES24_08185 [Acidimicrobiia bacterium]|nr:hypothetical protein [Acidimicrobiia bacterium]